ncbi:MAG: hypothetical protein ACKO2C_05780 [Actinomycetes bacterium]
MNPLDPRIVITGTGRAGTTLLVGILTDLGMDTGFTPGAEPRAKTKGGMERDILAPDAPRIVKSPELSRRLDGILTEGSAVVEHVIIPMRDLDIATASRVRATNYGSNLHVPGGLFGTVRATKQREALAVLQYQLMYTLAKHDVPHTLLLFPRFASDGEYLYEHLSFLDPSIPKERWLEVVAARTKPELIHETPLTKGEEAASVFGTAYNRGIARPIRGVKRVLGVGPKK